MRLADPRLLDRLAAEYVLGTLSGAARRRFERLLATRPDVRGHVGAWERRLMPLAETLEPRIPPARVWQRIEQRLFGGAPGRQPAADRGLVRRLLWWRAAALASALLALMLGAQLALGPPGDGSPARVALLQDGTGQVAVVLRVQTPRDPAAPTWVDTARIAGTPGVQGALELWVVPPGQPPRSLGLLPAGEGRMRMPAGALTGGAALAVSVEPRGGSPTGAPTGPVILTGRVLDL